MQIRWFAGAAEAAGVTEDEMAADWPDQKDGEQTVRAVLAELHPGAEQVLGRCSFLADGRSIPGDDPWPQTACVIDVLPPFTGG
ncbi:MULTISPECIES: MoaD/ThiS family protein [unclassified Luteococcus]|uniref:MoaD/ThiS family protein n=1 Tax=unclassified Luteococcus TaxID=2639923 RepID=UPI00313B704B